MYFSGKIKPCSNKWDIISMSAACRPLICNIFYNLPSMFSCFKMTYILATCRRTALIPSWPTVCSFPKADEDWRSSDPASPSRPRPHRVAAPPTLPSAPLRGGTRCPRLIGSSYATPRWRSADGAINTESPQQSVWLPWRFCQGDSDCVTFFIFPILERGSIPEKAPGSGWGGSHELRRRSGGDDEGRRWYRGVL